MECDDGYEDSTGALFYVTQCDSSGAWTKIKSCTGKHIEDDNLHGKGIDYFSQLVFVRRIYLCPRLPQKSGSIFPPFGIPGPSSASRHG